MNIQDELQKIHHQYGISEKANYEIQKLFDEQQKISYSEEEVLAILNELGWGVYVCYSGNIPISEWMLNAFEQFKKK